MIRKGRGFKSRGTKDRGRIVLHDDRIVKMALRAARKPQLDETTRDSVLNASIAQRASPVDAERIQRRFGERLREIRKKKGISQESLALICDLDRAYIGGVERGERNISLINICKIARGLGIPAKDLMP